VRGVGEREREREKENRPDRVLMLITAGSWIPDGEIIMKRTSKQLCKNRQSGGGKKARAD